MLRIKYELQNRGISQRELAKQLNMWPQAICRVVNGQEPPYSNRGKRIAEAIGWPTDRVNELFEPIEVR